MKSRENLVRLKAFQVAEKRRQIEQLDTMIAEFDRMAEDLEHQISVEEKKAGITDTSHFAYPTFAKAARQRRDNLMASRSELESQRDTAREALLEAETELEKAEMLEGRDNVSQSNSSETQRRAMIG
jgi:flagellar export protein FliJ